MNFVFFLIAILPLAQDRAERQESKPGPVFSIRGWDLGRDEPKNIPRWIREASEQGINLITFSHDIVMDWPDVLAGIIRNPFMTLG